MDRQHTSTLAARPRTERFWGAVGSALTAIAHRTGGSGSQCPLPEVRAAFRDLDGPSVSPVRDDPHQRLAA
jgi:hypothetical protein